MASDIRFLILEFVLHERNQDYRKKQNKGSCRGISEFTELKTVIVNKQGHGQRTVERTAVGHDERLFEELQPADHRRHRHEEDGKAQQGDGDRPGLPPRAGSVDLRRFVIRLRDAFERGDEDEHVEADCPPNGQDDQRNFRHDRILQPRDRPQAKRSQNIVEQPQRRVVQIAPDDGDRHDVGDRRHIENNPERFENAGSSGVDQQSDHEGNDDHERNADDNVEQGVENRFLKRRILQNFLVIVEADEADVRIVGQSGHIHVGKADDERDGDRQQRK